MSLSSQTAKITYRPLSPTAIFPISPINLEDDSVIKVLKNGVLLVVGTDYSADANNVTLNDDAVEGDTVVLYRLTPRTQTKELSVALLAVEEGLDRIVRQVQELQAAVPTPLWGYPEAEDGKVIGWDGEALTNITLEDYSALPAAIAINANAILVLNNNLSQLADRVTALEPVVAQQTVDINLVEGAIISLNSDLGVTNAYAVGLNGAISALTGRVSAIETYFGTFGEQELVNDISVAVDITDFLFDKTDHDHVIIEYAIIRSGQDSELGQSNINSSGTLHLVANDGPVSQEWTFAKGLEVVDPSGVTFSIVQTGAEVQVKYVSDDSITENNPEKVNKIKYRIIKFGV